MWRGTEPVVEIYLTILAQPLRFLVIRAELDQSALAFRCNQRLTHYPLLGALARRQPDLTPSVCPLATHSGPPRRLPMPTYASR